MPPPEPLVEYHESAITSHVALADSAKSALDAAQSGFATAEKGAAAAVAAIAGRLEERKEVQAKLALATSPADVAPLATQLEEILLELHHGQALLLAAKTTAIIEAARMARAEARLRRARAGVAAFTASKAEAQARSEIEQRWKFVINSPAFTSAVTKAEDDFDASPRTTPNYEDAKTRAEGDIPAALLTAARGRATGVLANAASKKGQVANALTALGNQLDDDSGFASQVEKLTIAFEAARVALRDRATLRLERIDRALRLLAGVVASPALTLSEIDAIGALTASVTAKKAEYDDAVALPESQTIIDALAADLVVLHDRWEAAVPDRCWVNLDAFDEAHRILTEATTPDATPVGTVFDSAETALAATLTAQLGNTLARALSAEDLVELTAEAERAAAPELIFSALRGDD